MMAHFQETIEQGGEVHLPKDLSARVGEFTFGEYGGNGDLQGEAEDGNGAKIVFRSLGVDRKSKTPYSDATQVRILPVLKCKWHGNLICLRN